MEQRGQLASRAVIGFGIGLMLLAFSLFEFGEGFWAIGAGTLSVLLVVNGMRLFRRQQPPTNFSQRAGRQPIPLLDGDIATKVLSITGLLLMLVGIGIGGIIEYPGPSALVVVAGVGLMVLAQRRFKRTFPDDDPAPDLEDPSG